MKALFSILSLVLTLTSIAHADGSSTSMITVSCHKAASANGPAASLFRMSFPDGKIPLSYNYDLGESARPYGSSKNVVTGFKLREEVEVNRVFVLKLEKGVLTGQLIFADPLGEQPKRLIHKAQINFQPSYSLEEVPAVRFKDEAVEISCVVEHVACG